MPTFDEIGRALDAGLHESRVRRAAAVNRASGHIDLDSLTREDVAESLHDLFRLKTRRIESRRAHPVALHAHREGWTLDDLQTRGNIGMSDFADLMAESLTTLVQTAFGDADELRPVVRDIRVRDFQPVTLGSMDFSASAEIGDDQPLPTLGFAIRQAERAGALKEFGGAIGFSRKTLSVYSDEIPAAFSDHAALTLPAVERQLLATALEGAACANVATDLTVAGMDALSNLIRASTNASGQILNLAPKTMVVPAELETKAKVLREALGARDLGILIVPELTSTTRYWLVCDPRRSAPITRLRLQGGTTPTVYRHTSFEGNTKLALRLETDIIFTGQPGLVRGGA